jgi:serine/threonine protein phosphatase PrpC
MESLPHIEITALTHRGQVRATNQDALAVDGWVAEIAMPKPRCSRHELTKPLLVALADGMGGHAAGEVASRYAIERLAMQPLGGEVDIADILAAINAELYRSMRARPELLGMGTTVAGLLLTASQVFWFNVGDSRVYRHCERRLQQLSTDDVPPGPRSGVLTQTLGGAYSFAPILPHIGAEDLLVPARYLLCSDGLTDMLDDRQIERAMSGTDEDALHALFARAMAAGGSDNISIILVSVTGS